ncbi:Type IV fimbrial biogenesis protein PilW [Pseudomonas marincola]|uniref:Type IV pilus assembly protein PilW n=1 Tax=Pseudomonas marincola TaxID=437900 RepID=A0A653E2D8_9PSED|nr:prepilin-type N-terminal cleavage/methylation domain-containing protein [Pseudomonas marincola]CAE6943892.1 Type IV fimbrial biogenesis protein PilW [Pseudomonas marincola]
MSKQTGMSLIELMVSILISSLLILGAIELFASTSASNRTNVAVARVQESGRIALEIIGSDARRAGYQGCRSARSTLKIKGLTLPNDAIEAGDRSITFNYATTQDTGVPFSYYKTCQGEALFLKRVTYSQCETNRLCMDDEPVLDHAHINAIEFAVVADSKTLWVESSEVTPEQLADTRAVRVSLDINDARDEVARTYSNTYQLRNRL